VVAETCDRVGVAYAGDIVEMGQADDVLYRMKHPYTQGLLGALPRPTQRGLTLQSIEGSVPDGLQLPTGCPFHPRCPQVMDVCMVEKPASYPVGSNEHQVACYLYREEAA
jgi:oligopeptide/dipeptide ABC transporter ATP-binding protein